ncbi:MAG: ATP-dependent helicase RecG [Campylobacterota bacterium]|nr:ATP-dependent helicase RecG [Campylobacterota bacterium]
MQLTKEQEEKFKKLGIASWCDLALLIPHSYEDLRLHTKLQPHNDSKKALPQLIDATIESLIRAKNSLQINFYAHNFAFSIKGVIFNPKRYMLHQYKEGERNYYYGTIECKSGFCTMSMPKKVTNIGQITPKYKTPLRNDVMLKFVQNNLTKERLTEEGLREDVAQEILALHFPTQLPSKELDVKALNALKYAELFNYMKTLSKKRRYFSSMTNKCQGYLEWAKNLPFELTREQFDAIEDIKNDFLKDVAARRVVVGDVGSGKTMVILASAFMMYPHRSILMAPTTILANQLYEEAQKFLPYAKAILVTNKTKKQDLEGFDFIIGTHALLHRELPYASLVMVDEQHRFGTLQRSMLEKLVSQGDKRAHFLQFSATPIPRTQAMIESAHIDVSLITTTPFKKDITSKIIRKNDFKNLLEHIKNEINKDNQVLLVYPLVEQSDMMEYQSIEEARGYWEKNFDGVYVTHGADKEKEATLLEFREKGNILVATTVVEVGISLPRLSTVVIVGAERLGLSTLHQLRGRVSRTGLKGHCFLYTNQKEPARLEHFTKTTSGFDIAELDLKYRKSGDLLKGANQSGKEFKWVDLAEDEEIVKQVKMDLV